MLGKHAIVRRFRIMLKWLRRDGVVLPKWMAIGHLDQIQGRIAYVWHQQKLPPYRHSRKLWKIWTKQKMERSVSSTLLFQFCIMHRTFNTTCVFRIDSISFFFFYYLLFALYNWCKSFKLGVERWLILPLASENLLIHIFLIGTVVRYKAFLLSWRQRIAKTATRASYRKVISCRTWGCVITRHNSNSLTRTSGPLSKRAQLGICRAYILRCTTGIIAMRKPLSTWP